MAGKVCALLIALAACEQPSGVLRPAPRDAAPALPAARTDESTPGRRYGTVMIEVGHRLQVLGRATGAGRWELALHEARRLGALFREDLPAATPPREATVEVLLARSHGFLETTLPALDAAVRSRDPAKMTLAYGAVVAACNGCHVSAGFEFIEIPAEPGAPMPRTDAP